MVSHNILFIGKKLMHVDDKKNKHRLRYTCYYENKFVEGRVRQKLNDVVGLMKSAIPCGVYTILKQP